MYEAGPVIVGAILFGADEMVARFVAERIPHVGADGFGPCRALGVIRSAKLVGGVVFHNFKGATIEMSGASDRADWLRPTTLRKLFDYPFNQIGCANLLTITPRKNKRARKIDEYLGFKIVGVIDKAYGTDDAVIYQMPRNTCRWIKDKDNGK